MTAEKPEGDVALLPCPFCGDTPTLYADGSVSCSSHTCEPSPATTTIAKWNRRAVPRGNMQKKALDQAQRNLAHPPDDMAALVSRLRAAPLFGSTLHAECADMLESQATRIATLTEALERARGCIKGLCARTPVRDVAETLAEIDSALSAGHANPS